MWMWMWRTAGFALGLALLATVFVGGRTRAEPVAVRVTHYTWTGSPMASGIWPYHGAAACSFNFPMGTIIRFRDGREVTCLDRGRLGWDGWVDIYAATWAEGQRIQQAYEYYSGRELVEIVRWGY
jgi:hypothetical protein